MLDHAIAVDIWTKIPAIFDHFSARGGPIIDDDINKAKGAAKEPQSTTTRHKPAKLQQPQIANPLETDGRGDRERSTFIPVLQVGGF